MNYVLISSFLDLPAYSAFIPNPADPLYLICGQNPSVVIAKATAHAYPGYFQLVLTITAQDKLFALSRKNYDNVVWIPQIGHYFTSEDKTLDVWRIIGDTGTDWECVLLSGAAFPEEVILEINKADMLSEYAQILTGDEEEDSSSIDGSSVVGGNSSSV